MLVDDKIVMYDNFKSLKGINDPSKIFRKLKKNHGKFLYNHEVYYYYKINDKSITKIAISDDTYINKTRRNFISNFPIVLGTCFLIGPILVLWSSIIVSKIRST